ncbi:hypothetical protein CXB51_010346 [Gossypium anomalum]|uniref:Reverse transcriptase Ty1/copia-type domain-containing protein n=1 Tax=Gossypium anomalum TaxID=47600 RepID=A0A8J5YTY3_9ROSI|nr:hypothetical protein CXB51_010346 [Gossypium anomalum]
MSMPSPSGWPYQMALTTNWSNPFLGAPMQSAPPSTTVQPHALLATPDTVRDNAWYPDSGATHHLTHSATTIGYNPSHDGPSKVYVGNGNALPTKEVLPRGSLHRGLYRLHLPDARMKDNDSHTAQCLTVNASAPLSAWHSRLGHPCKNILLKAFGGQLPFSPTVFGTMWLSLMHVLAQNGIVERKHRQIVETGLSMLAQAFIPVTYWNEAFSHAIYLINRLPSAPLGFVSPYEKLFQTKPATRSLEPLVVSVSQTSDRTIAINFNLNQHYVLSWVSLHFTKVESQPHTSSKLLVLAPKTQTNSPMSTMPIRTTLHTPALSLSSPPTSTQSPSAHLGSPTSNNHIPPPSHPTTQNIHAMTTRSKAGVFKPKCTTTPRPFVHYLYIAAPLAANGCTDFRDTFSPVVRAATIKTVLALAVTKRWLLRQVDVNNAFLNGELTEEIFMDQPPRFELPDLNGQKIASKADPSLFILKSSVCHLLLMAYVDDIVITGSSCQCVDNVLQQLHAKFALKDMGQLYYFLGIEVQTSSQGLFLNQKNQALANSHLYRSTIDMLQYLCITRPDLSYCVNKLSQYMNAPSDSYWQAVKRVLRYLIGTIDHGLWFSQGPLQLVSYSDADWASSVDDRRSTTGYVIFLGLNPITWYSKKQAVVSRSSSEAEYRSLANCVSELLGIKQLLEEVGVIVEQTPVV